MLKRLMVGRPLNPAQSHHQLLPKWLALPLFCSDPLSSVAYATDEIILVLILGGLAALSFTPWVGAAVVVGRSDDTPLPCPIPRVAGDYCCYQGSLFSSEMARLEAAFVNVNRLGAVVVAEHVSDSLQVRVDGGRGCFHAESAHAPAVHRSTWRTCSTGTARTQRLARRRCPPRWRLSHPPSCGS